MVVRLRESKTACRGGFRVELDQHRGLLTYDPRVMAWFHDHYLWRNELEGAAIGIRALDVTAGQEANVCMHAERRTDERLEVGGPAEARRIDKALHATVCRPDAVNGNTAKLLVGGTFDGGKQGIHGLLPCKRDDVLIQVGSNVGATDARCQEGMSPSQAEESLRLVRVTTARLYTRPVSSVLSCQRRWAAAWSYDAAEDSTERFFTKYVLVTPDTSGEVAR